MAGLEMAREGTLRLRQEVAFGPILLRRAEAVVMDGAGMHDVADMKDAAGMEGGA
jgi:chromatin segregation and condensation protein Rec8/ScpA/Scc1 (kleisin family)